MTTENMEAVNRYFDESTKKVYIERCYKIESFDEYLSYRYRDNCYYYSTYALMGLLPDDFLVRGYIDVTNYENYHHGWVELTYEGEEYVFDSLIKGIVPKDEWYTTFNPRINYKMSQKEILDAFLNKKNAVQIQNNFWQFKPIVMNTTKSNISYNQIISFDKDNGYVPLALSLARITISTYTSKITRFIAYSKPSG